MQRTVEQTKLDIATATATAIATAIAALTSSAKFREWHKTAHQPAAPVPEFIRVPTIEAALELHYSPAELAQKWGVSTETIRVIFRDEPGVLKIGKPGNKYKRQYFTLRIPETVAERVHQRLSA
jgi:hypothetical protein